MWKSFDELIIFICIYEYNYKFVSRLYVQLKHTYNEIIAAIDSKFIFLKFVILIFINEKKNRLFLYRKSVKTLAMKHDILTHFSQMYFTLVYGIFSLTLNLLRFTSKFILLGNSESV